MASAENMIQDYRAGMRTQNLLELLWIWGLHVGLHNEWISFNSRGRLKRSARAVRAQCNYLGVWP